MTETLSLSDVEALAQDCLTRAGVPTEITAAVAAEIVASERAGERSHGLEALLRDLRLVRYGRLVIDAGRGSVAGSGSVLQVNAHHGFAAAAIARSLPDLAALTEAQGLALLHLRRASAPGAMHAPMADLRERGFLALSLNEAGEARLADPTCTAPRTLRGITASPLMALLGIAPPDADTPLGGPVAYRGWLFAANPEAIGPLSLALGTVPAALKRGPAAEDPGARKSVACPDPVERIDLPAGLLEQIVNA